MLDFLARHALAILAGWIVGLLIAAWIVGLFMAVAFGKSAQAGDAHLQGGRDA